MREYAVIEPSSADEIALTWPVMRQLRPHHTLESYVDAVQRMMETSTYRLAALVDDGVVCGVAGYRLMEMLYCGRIVYVDDLSVDASERSKGYGGALLAWLMDHGRKNNCAQIHLDSGVQREAAHKFYFREGFGINAYHFRRDL